VGLVAFIRYARLKDHQLPRSLRAERTDDYQAGQQYENPLSSAARTLHVVIFSLPTGWGFAGPDRFLTADQAYIAPGYWNAVSGGFSGTYYTSPGPSGSTSTVWSTTITSSDVLGKNDSGLELSATWTPSPSNADNAQYEIYDDGTLVDTVTVNQQLAPNGTPGTLN